MNKKEFEYHLSLLQLNKEEYTEWCKKHKFNTGLNKTQKEIKQERVLRTQQFNEAKKRKEIEEEKKFKAEKQEYINQKIKKYQIIDPDFRTFIENLSRDGYTSFLGNSYPFHNNAENENFELLRNIFKYKKSWKQSITDYKPIHTNFLKLKIDLVQFLFFKYNIPAYFVKAMTDQFSESVVELAQGKSIREFKFPFSVSKKEANCLMNVKTNINKSFHYHVIFGLIHAWSDNELIASVVSDSFLSEIPLTQGRKDFYEQFFVLFKYQMFDYSQIRTILDYLRTKENDNAFSFKNKTLLNLLRDAENWHLQLSKRKEEALANIKYKQIFEPWNIQYSEEERWSIEQIINEKDLFLEGKAMHHCVYSYKDSILNEKCYILSLKLNDKRVATLEIRGRSLVQARLKYNKILDLKESLIIDEWMKKNKIIKHSF
jgi:hypothetical protein